ncbi:hypothetical protein CU098_013558 [Rhizopus stolonifer]|uniref:Xylanolytic transcriptional activator regulatory domain-containing protein n=1 Tax=Rhizopus stolonifer TaxID=4846 RepID=A0A367KY78_RHIST|nr:hypothetical protein CU098_013558 [Rhizopus stolonifer]
MFLLFRCLVSYAENLENRIEQLEEEIQMSSLSNLEGDTLYCEIERSKKRRLENGDDQNKLADLLENCGILDPSLRHSYSVQYLGSISTFHILCDKIDLSKTKWSSHSIRRFGDDVVLVYNGKKREEKEGGLCGEDVEFEWPKDIEPVKEDFHKYIYAMTGIDKHTSARLLKIYFANIHPILPVIDKTEFINQYRGRLNSRPSGELLNAMFGAASRFAEHACSEQETNNKLPSDAQWELPTNWSIQFFDRAEYLISNQNIPTLSKLQAILLVLHHRKDRNLKISEAWQLEGLAQLLGLHRSCEHWDIPRREKETRKRIWWVLYMTDVFQSSILGRADMTVEYPSATADWEEVMDAYKEDKEKILKKESFPRFPSLVTPIQATTAAENKPRIYELFLELIKLSRIINRILSGLHTPQAKKYSFEYGSDRIVATLDRELKEWRYDFSETIKSSHIPDFNQKRGHFAPTVAREELIKGYLLSKKIKEFTLNAYIMAQFYEKLIAHLDNFEKNRLTEVAEKSITVMSSEENTNYENPFCLSDAAFMGQESFDFLQSGFNSTGNMNLAGLQTTVIPESLMDLDNLHLFRNDPSNLFWSLPSEFDNNTLMTWLDNMNDVEWLPLEQSFE